MVEDSIVDAELLQLELRRAGVAQTFTRVDNEIDYVRELEAGYDLIISDYSLPQFGALRALEILRARGAGIPFIIVSGSIGDDLATAALKLGATAHLLKDRLTRLGPVIEQVLRNKMPER